LVVKRHLLIKGLNGLLNYLIVLLFYGIIEKDYQNVGVGVG